MGYIFYSLESTDEGAHSGWGGDGHGQWKPLADEMASELDMKEFYCRNLKGCLFHRPALSKVVTYTFQTVLSYSEHRNLSYSPSMC